jgi:ubiquinone/menaquinone biosynthesis C-methylase UbiE
VIHGGEAGYDRLGVLARAWHDTTFALLERAGLQRGMRCLDLGCGSGDVTRELARRVGPSGSAVGVDMDAVKLDLSRKAAADEGLPNVEFRQLNVYEWSEPESYDVAYCRYLLHHLSRPVDVIGSMWESLRPGGVLVVEDADFSGAFCDPPNQAFSFWVDTYQQVLERNGGDPRCALRLRRRFREAGVPEPVTTVVQRADAEGEATTLPYLSLLATIDSLTSAGVSTREEIDAALLGLRAGAEDPQQVWGLPRVLQCWSRKPAT